MWNTRDSGKPERGVVPGMTGSVGRNTWLQAAEIPPTLLLKFHIKQDTGNMNCIIIISTTYGSQNKSEWIREPPRSPTFFSAWENADNAGTVTALFHSGGSEQTEITQNFVSFQEYVKVSNCNVFFFLKRAIPKVNIFSQVQVLCICMNLPGRSPCPQQQGLWWDRPCRVVRGTNVT